MLYIHEEVVNQLIAEQEKKIENVEELIEVILKASSHTKEQIKGMLVRKDTAIIGLVELLFRMNPDDFRTVEKYYDQLPFLANNVISRIKEVADDEDKLSELENDLQSKIGNQMASLMLMMLV